MLTIDAAELDYGDEYDPMNEVFYAGQPFTGCSTTDREVIDYVNGRAHGQYALTFANGTRSAEGIYQDGECISMQSWYENGTLRETYQATNVETKKWDHDGVLAYYAAENETGIYETKWFYKDGAVKQHYTANRRTDYFDKKGQLAMRVTFGHPLNSVRYDDSVLKTSYLDVLTNYWYQQDTGNETATVEWYFFGWVWKLLTENELVARQILTPFGR